MEVNDTWHFLNMKILGEHSPVKDNFHLNRQARPPVDRTRTAAPVQTKSKPAHLWRERELHAVYFYIFCFPEKIIQTYEWSFD